MPAITLEPIRPDEFHRYSDWFNESASDFLSGAPESLASNFGDAAESLAWKLVLGNETLALVTISVDYSNIGKLNLVVDPRVRRRGVGSAAIKLVIARPEVQSLRGLVGEVSASNIGARKIFIKNGFAKAGYTQKGNLEFRR
ncbi:MAG: GNAT family N-acetyltransferase [Candidatus Saccharimonadales bacterium]